MKSATRQLNPNFESIKVDTWTRGLVRGRKEWTEFQYTLRSNLPIDPGTDPGTTPS